jgi:hypothetical protein
LRPSGWMMGGNLASASQTLDRAYISSPWLAPPFWVLSRPNIPPETPHFPPRACQRARSFCGREEEADAPRPDFVGAIHPVDTADLAIAVEHIEIVRLPVAAIGGGVGAAKGVRAANVISLRAICRQIR